jgi:hypothetical protein
MNHCRSGKNTFIKSGFPRDILERLQCKYFTNFTTLDSSNDFGGN